jgi:hypothetical protein
MMFLVTVHAEKHRPKERQETPFMHTLSVVVQDRLQGLEDAHVRQVDGKQQEGCLIIVFYIPHFSLID